MQAYMFGIISYVRYEILCEFVQIIELFTCCRYKRLSLNSPNGWKNEITLISYVKTIFICLILYHYATQIINVTFDLKIFNVYNICIGSKDEHHPSLNGILIMFPMMIVVLITAALDIKCYIIVKNHSNVVDDLSLRTSIVSISLMFPYIFGSLVILNLFDLDNLSRYFVVMFICVFLSIIRNPIILLFTFRVNERNRQVDLMEEREKKRQIEINFALKKREEQRQAKMIPTISKSVELTPVEC